jgi:hypothetical protein
MRKISTLFIGLIGAVCPMLLTAASAAQAAERKSTTTSSKGAAIVGQVNLSQSWGQVATRKSGNRNHAVTPTIKSKGK